MTTLRIEWLGRRDYGDVWQVQKELAARRLTGDIPDTLLLLEHSPTITLGRGAEAGNVLADARTLAQAGVTLVESDRGGDVTYHGPGQLVGYPILNLRNAPHTPDLHHYLRLLEETLLTALTEWSVVGERFPGYTGVWTRANGAPPEKIAAIGVKASRWITQHGFALNVNPDLTHFDWIVPCGIGDYGVTSLTRLLDRPVPVAAALAPVAEAFARVFGYATVLPDEKFQVDGRRGTGYIDAPASFTLPTALQTPFSP